jgi:ferredoxin
MELSEEDQATRAFLRIFPKKRVRISTKCTNCLKCLEVCPTGAIYLKNGKLLVEVKKCVACYACVITCPEKAITIEWFDGRLEEVEVEDNI